MVGEWVIHLLINGVYWGYNPLILTFLPALQQDIQVRGGPPTSYKWSYKPYKQGIFTPVTHD